MKYYNLEGSEISKDEWILYYSKIYFSGYHIKYKNQKVKIDKGSSFIEDLVERILNGKEDLNPKNIILIHAWKTGNVNHKLSEEQKGIVYYPRYQNELKDKRFYNRVNYNEAIIHLTNNIRRYTNDALEPEKILYEIKNLPSLGAVYAINFIYFITHGEYPIYDRFANFALKGIIEEQIPNFQYSYENKKRDWQMYQNEYISKILKVFGKKNIERRLDQALYVYGHFFQKKTQKTKPCC